ASHPGANMKGLILASAVSAFASDVAIAQQSAPGAGREGWGMGGGMGWGMGAMAVLGLILLVLVIAALVKYVFSR
ncbi:MAG: hypothetical protein ACYCZX_21010, partial [Rhodospirillaceae bacterium]